MRPGVRCDECARLLMRSKARYASCFRPKEAKPLCVGGRRGYAPELELVAEDDSAGSGFGRRATSGSRRPMRNLRAAA
jgi:hypothetical protein